MTGILPTEKDGEWVGEALAGVLPEELDSRVWVQTPDIEYEGRLTNQFYEKGQNLFVLVSISPINIEGSDTKQVGYHVVTFRREGDKIKKPNTADVSRVRGTFFGRSPTSKEMRYEGTVGDSRAYHFMTIFEHKPNIIIAGA